MIRRAPARFRLLLPVLFVLAWLPLLAQAADVQATLDRSQVQLGETVTLNLHLQGGFGASAAMPDLAPLSQDFAVLGTSSSSSVSIVNGQSSSELTFGVALRPLHAGRLTIPALAVAGGRTRPLTLDVGPAGPTPPSGSSADGGRNVFLEASAEPSHAYVGEQIAFTVKLYFAASLGNASLDDPNLPGVDVSHPGNDIDYQTQRDGRTYNVIERRYVMVPQRAGTLRIPPVQFQGDLLDPNDPGSFLGMGAPVSAASTPVTVQVQAVPADWGTSAWLPARQLSLSLDGAPGAADTLRVGQPFTVTMNLQATGLPYDALPALSLPALDGATVYPDKPVTGNRSDGPWVVGRRQQNFAIVPDRPGKLVLPETTLKWWNVSAGRAEVARIPARTLNVLPAVGGASGASAAAAASALAAPADAASTAPTAKKPARQWHGPSWRWLVLIAAAVLLGALLAWRPWRRRQEPSIVPAATPTDSKRWRQDFIAAARSGDSQAQARSLLAWARSERPSIHNLGALAAALESTAQREAIDALQRQRYAPAGERTAAPALEEAFAAGFRWRVPSGGGDDDGSLQPLYPFKLR